MHKHLRIKGDTHSKFLLAKGLMAIQGKFISVDDVAEIAIQMLLDKLKEDNK